MRKIIPVMLLLAAATSVAAQDVAPHQLTLRVNSTGGEQARFRVETTGSGGNMEVAATSVAIRGENAARIVEFSTPAVLTITGEPGLKLRLTSTSGLDLVVVPAAETPRVDQAVELRGSWVHLDWHSDGKKVGFSAQNITSRSRKP